jgi:cystathionine beta-lyase/cystathionine gamma-synthase
VRHHRAIAQSPGGCEADTSGPVGALRLGGPGLVALRRDRAAILARAESLLAHDEAMVDDPVVPPIHQTSLFTFRTYEEMVEAFAGRKRRPIYSRGDNPTVQAFEAKLAALEGGEAARGFSSGMAAISATILAFVSAGERIVCVNHVYSDAFRLFEKLLPRLGIRVDYVDGGHTPSVLALLKGAKLLYLENPTSMVFELQDLRTLAAAARREGLVSVIDNSWATPLFQQPLMEGVDLVIHSASKYLGGHSDTVAGIVAGSAALIGRINDQTYPYLGAKLAPFEAWLLLRGLRSLPLRLPRHEASGLVLAERLKAHDDVLRVMHPVYSNHPGRSTLAGFSGLFSFEVSDAINVARFSNALRVFRMGVSWGGHESLVVPAAAALRQSPAVNAMARFGITAGTIRIHIGLENCEDLWTDLEQALALARD